MQPMLTGSWATTRTRRRCRLWLMLATRCSRVCKYVYMYISYTHTHTQAHTHAYTHTCILYIQYAFMHVYIYMQPHVCNTYIYLQAFSRTWDAL